MQPGQVSRSALRDAAAEKWPRLSAYARNNMVWKAMEFARWGEISDRIAQMDVIQGITSDAQVRAIAEVRTRQFHQKVRMFDESTEKRKTRRPAVKRSFVVLATEKVELPAATDRLSDDEFVVSGVNKTLKTDTRKVATRSEKGSTHTPPESSFRRQYSVEGPPWVRPAEKVTKRDCHGT